MKPPNIFVLMPFARKYDDIYQIGIKEPLNKIGLSCNRADDIQFSSGILDQVIKNIKESQLIVADMTGNNTNVAYEVGYAHAIGKKSILITQNIKTVPFDLRGINFIEYGKSIIKLREKLTKRIQTILSKENPLWQYK